MCEECKEEQEGFKKLKEKKHRLWAQNTWFQTGSYQQVSCCSLGKQFNHVLHQLRQMLKGTTQVT